MKLYSYRQIFGAVAFSLAVGIITLGLLETGAKVGEARQFTSASPGFYANARLTDGTSFLPLPTTLENARLAVNQPVVAVTTLSAANTTVTLTLPAAGVGLFHHITMIQAVRTCTAAITGSAVLAYTSTNLPGTLAWTAGNACPVGTTNFDIGNQMTQPLKSSVANTATTIVAPAAGAAGVIRLTAYYYTAP
jgi:hypothetical protein